MGSKITMQIALLVVSVVIIATYINPAFQTLREVQDETIQYQEALVNASSFQTELARLEAESDSFSLTQLNALDEYLPLEVDLVAVMQDLTLIAESAGLELEGISSDGAGQSSAALAGAVSGQGQFVAESDLGMSELLAYSFSFEASGTYEQLKDFLRSVERNKYPLKISGLSFSASDGIFYTYSITVETYSLTEQSN